MTTNPILTGRLIGQLRRERGMTQKDLAARLGVSDKAVSKWETGGSFPEVTLLPLLADTLGVTVDELLRGGRAQPTPPPAADTAAPPSDDAHRTAAEAGLQDAGERFFLWAALCLLLVCASMSHFLLLSFSPLLLVLSPLLLLYAAYRHRTQAGRLCAFYAGLDCRTAQRQRTGACALFWSVWGCGLLLWLSTTAWLWQYGTPYFVDRGYWVEMTVQPNALVSFAACLGVLLLFAVWYHRMDADTPLRTRAPVLLFALSLCVAALLTADRLQYTIGHPEHFSDFAKDSIVLVIATARPWLAPVCAAALLLLTALLWRRGRLSAVQALCAAAQTVLALWLAQRTVGVLLPSVSSNIKLNLTLYPGRLFELLLLGGLLLEGSLAAPLLRRKPKPPQA